MNHTPFSFEWDEQKNRENYEKHGLWFEDAQWVFYDKNRLILSDVHHSQFENRYFCIGNINRGIATVRFTVRNGKIRIFGAVFWRSGRKKYLETHGKN